MLGKSIIRTGQRFRLLIRTVQILCLLLSGDMISDKFHHCLWLSFLNNKDKNMTITSQGGSEADRQGI